jgi:hypothetical protein
LLRDPWDLIERLKLSRHEKDVVSLLRVGVICVVDIQT